VTSAMPIIRAAAVEAVRPGFRREFSLATSLTVPSGRMFGNSTGHSGWNPRTLLSTHMVSAAKSVPMRIAAIRMPRNVLRSRAASTIRATWMATDSRSAVSRFRAPVPNAAERMSQAQLVEARTKAQTQQIEAQAKAEMKRIDAEAQAVAQRLQAQADAESLRIKGETEIAAFRQSEQAAAAFAANPALLRLRELEALKDLAKASNARIYIGFDKYGLPRPDGE